jgi:hypothetical protein
MQQWKSAIPIVLAGALGLATAWTPLSLGDGRLHVDAIPTADLPIGLTQPVLTPAMIQERGTEILSGLNYLLASGALVATFTALVLLSVARAAQRRQEVLVHRAVGASRKQLLRRGANEGVVLAFIALLAGSTFGLVTLQYAQAAWPGTLDPAQSALPFVIAAAIGAAISLGVLVPLLSLGAMRPHLPPLTPLLAPAICALQVAVCFAVLAESRQVLREGVSLTRERGSLEDGRGGRVFQLMLATAPTERSRQLGELIKRTHDRFDVASISSPGTLEGVGTANLAITECGMCSQGTIATPLRPVAVSINAVSADTFRALNAQLIEGRWIRDADNSHAPRVAVISRALARAHFQNGEPLGRAIQLGQGPHNRYVVVGVVADRRPQGLGSGIQPAYAVYTSILQVAPAAVELLMRPREIIDWATLSAIPAGLIRAALPEAQWRARRAAPIRWFGTALLSDAAAVALIALLGIAAAVAMWVNSLLPELAVRRAVGARRRDVLLRVLGRCAKMFIPGLGLGVMLAYLGADPLSAIAPGIQGIDVQTVIEVALAVIGTTGLAISIPIWRACRLTPVELLTTDDF